jgi:protein-L-isoaspartate(D-aspartate) O-methyltransferase
MRRVSIVLDVSGEGFRQLEYHLARAKGYKMKEVIYFQSIGLKRRLLDGWRESSFIIKKNVLEAFDKINRENFIPKALQEYAYIDIPLPIGYGQAISQPTMVMFMVQALDIEEHSTILEIGTGSGYQAAIMASIAQKGSVVSTEIIPNLAEFARVNLAREGINNVEVYHCDGSIGFLNRAPFNRIVFTAASPCIPEQLIDQLTEKGVLVAPVGRRNSMQQLIKICKNGENNSQEILGNCRFVPLRGLLGEFR